MEKPMTRKESSGMVRSVRGIDKLDSEWWAVQKKRLSGEYFPGITSETEVRFTSVMYRAGKAFMIAKPRIRSIISRNGECGSFFVSSHLSSLEVRGKGFSADIIAFPTAQPHAFELSYSVEISGKIVERRREPLTETKLRGQLHDLGLLLANYGRQHSPFF